MKDAILKAAYAAGFEASGEGWNAEYPFADHNRDFEDDAEWTVKRDERLRPLLAAIDAALAGALLDCVHQPNPTDLTRWDIAPGKHKAFSKLCADQARIRTARKQPTSSETNVNESATNGA